MGARSALATIRYWWRWLRTYKERSEKKVAFNNYLNAVQEKLLRVTSNDQFTDDEKQQIQEKLGKILALQADFVLAPLDRIFAAKPSEIIQKMEAKINRLEDLNNESVRKLIEDIK